MKKLIMTPKKDTFTICLPQDWIGKPLVCILKHPEEKDDYPTDSEFVSEVRDSSFEYNAMCLKRKHRPRRKRLRRIRGGKNKYL